MDIQNREGFTFNLSGMIPDVDLPPEPKGNIYKFIEDSNKCIFIVDCENSDPYSLCAAIRNLDAEKLSKIEKIILFDDVHAASAWEMLGSYIKMPVEYILIERLQYLRKLKLIEGRVNNLYISASVAKSTEQEAECIKQKAFDDQYYKEIFEAMEKGKEKRYQKSFMG